MFKYNICTEADKEIFYKQCAALEKHIPDLKKMRILEDVDGSLVQIYYKDRKEIIVYNSEYVGSVTIKSEIELEQFFK